MDDVSWDNGEPIIKEVDNREKEFSASYIIEEIVNRVVPKPLAIS